MRMTRKKVLVTLGAAISVGALATAGFAFWTTSGSGSGSGSTTTGTADESTSLRRRADHRLVPR